MAQNKIYIYGKHALIEALNNAPNTVRKVYFAPQMDDMKLRELVKKSGLNAEVFSTGKMTQEVGGMASHQGVMALISLNELVVPYDRFVSGLKPTKDTSLVLLNEIQDPHNVGAVIRSAAAFGVSGILIPEHNQAPITGAVVKVSAGMAFRIPLVSIGNTNHTVRDLKEKGFWVYGLDAGGNQLSGESFDAPALFVLGNEAKGIRMKTRDICDTLISIPMNPRCESLNAAASAAVALYAWSVKHPHALKGK